MADENIKLIKDFLSNQDNIDRSFSELISKKNRITLNEFFDYYNNLFYDIPQLGPLSHTELVSKSTEYIGNYNDPRDIEIQDLNIQIDHLMKKVNELEQGEFANELEDLTKTVVISLKLGSPAWPNKFDRIRHTSLETHRLKFDDFINSAQYFHGSYDTFENKTFTFQTTSPTFTLYYNGRNKTRKWNGNDHDDGVAWRKDTTTYSIPENEDTFTVDLSLSGDRAYNITYANWQEIAAYPPEDE